MRQEGTTVSPWIQAQRLEQAERGAAVSRSLRDADLVEAGGTPECLVLIGGSAALTQSGAASVCRWLWDIINRARLVRVASALFKAVYRVTAPSPEAHGYPARTRASLAFARQLLDAADEQSDGPLDHKPLSDHACAISVWLASAIEGAGLSEVARALYARRLESDAGWRETAVEPARVSAAIVATAQAIERAETPTLPKPL
jgi:hypothetical protein